MCSQTRSHETAPALTYASKRQTEPHVTAPVRTGRTAGAGLLILAIVVGVPGLICYFIVRRIVRGRRARRDVMTLADSLTDVQAEQSIRPTFHEPRTY